MSGTEPSAENTNTGHFSAQGSQSKEETDT